MSYPARSPGGPQARVAPLLLVAALFVVPVAGAAEVAVGARPAFPAAHSPRLRAEVMQRLTSAQQAAEAEQYDRAVRLLDALQRDYTGPRALNSYERANLFYFYAFIHETRGQTDAAIRDYEQVLAEHDLPQTMQLGTRANLAQLYLKQEDWAHAAVALEAWFRLVDAPPPEAHMQLAEARYRLKQYPGALREVDAALAEAVRRHLPPQESWYVLLRAVCYEGGDLKRTAATLELLARNWPRKDYLLQLSAIYAEKHQGARQIAAMEATYLGGWLGSESELLALAYLYLDAGLPLRAARLLEAELAAKRIGDGAKNLELLGVAWRHARDGRRAMPWLESAAERGNDAAMWARLAGIELEEERPEQAADAARRALALGGTVPAAELRVTLGTALYRMGQLPEARAAFAAVDPASDSARTAQQWMRFLDTEMARAAELARDV